MKLVKNKLGKPQSNGFCDTPVMPRSRCLAEIRRFIAVVRLRLYWTLVLFTFPGRRNNQARLDSGSVVPPTAERLLTALREDGKFNPKLMDPTGLRGDPAACASIPLPSVVVSQMY